MLHEHADPGRGTGEGLHLALNVAAIEWTQGEQAAFMLGPVSLSASRAGRRYRVEGLAALAHDVRLRDGAPVVTSSK